MISAVINQEEKDFPFKIPGVKKTIRYVEKNGCWECTSHNPWFKGYPCLTVDGKTRLMARWVFLHCNGFQGRGEVTRHTCDNKLCINPDHLIKGTRRQNMEDRDSRGRTSRGETSGMCKLTREEVREIFVCTGGNLETGKRFGISGAHVCMIRKRRIWREATEGLTSGSKNCRGDFFIPH